MRAFASRFPAHHSRLPARFFSTAEAASLQNHHYHRPSPPSPLLNLGPKAAEKEAGKDLIKLIKSCPKKSHLPQIHTHLIHTSYLLNPTIFLHFLSRISLPGPLQDLSYGRRIFQHYPKPNVSLYGTMIRAHSLSHNNSAASLGFELYKEMLDLGFSSDGFCSSFAIKCCVKMESLLNGVQVHSRILRDGYKCDSFLSTTLMDFYSLSGKCDDACKVFDEMSHRDTAAWNVLISCYIRNKRTRDALSVFDIMEKSNWRQPDDVTCLLVLEACGKLNALEFGEKVHKYVKEGGFDSSMKISNSLIAMYSRCGCVEKAYEVFESLANKDVVTWSAMIAGLASNGHGEQAIRAFRKMQRVGVVPDDQTCTAVLSGCSHSGLVDQGRMFFDIMRKELGIVPNLYHYGCMVDMMGRAGLLDEAYKLICSMEVRPDAAIWRTLLGACRNYKHSILGERVVEHLIELKAEEAGDYVLLLNIYSSINDWEKVTEIRKLMKEKGIRTTPASCTIELKGKIHEFMADDVSHPRKKEIYDMLDEINKQLKIAGYVAETIAELHNTGAEEKRTRMSYHSEKLAIAFAILATPPGTKIRIAKDLRICLDCHNFAKMVSTVYNREVVIRDRNRFHHFREGHCSCNDYW
ncbi:pentatricopeptide repeat-containing protein At3g47530-like [Coffea arabica]|uniref:Pentatricopeptide repeat-containing protein At3g47530-like n=1 Tax=Coffea arabica TaxID=13443 RepID=A0A6P6X9Y3_COFAR